MFTGPENTNTISFTPVKSLILVDISSYTSQSPVEFTVNVPTQVPVALFDLISISTVLSASDATRAVKVFAPLPKSIFLNVSIFKLYASNTLSAIYGFYYFHKN